MKILYISFVDISLPKGPSVNEREFIPALSKLTDGNSHFVIPKPKFDVSSDLENVSVSFIKNSKNRTPHLWLAQQIQVVRTVKKLLKEQQFDMLLFRSGVFPFSVNIINSFSGLPYAVKTAGSGQYKVFEEKPFFVRKLKPLNQFLFKKVIRGAIAVDVVSTIQKGSLENITGVYNKIHFVDNGVNTDRFIIKDKLAVREKLGLSHFDQIIGYVGGSPWERGGLQIIESLPELLETYPKLGGVIVGGGSKMDILYTKAKELGVESNVHFAGEVPFSEVCNYINAFDIGVSQLYKDKQGSSEQKVRQYLACGKPVLVSPGAVNNFVEENKVGYIVSDPYDISEFTRKVLSLFSDLNYSTVSTTEKIREYAIQNLSVDSRVKQRLVLYRKELGE